MQAREHPFKKKNLSNISAHNLINNNSGYDNCQRQSSVACTERGKGEWQDLATLVFSHVSQCDLVGCCYYPGKVTIAGVFVIRRKIRKYGDYTTHTLEKRIPTFVRVTDRMWSVGDVSVCLWEWHVTFRTARTGRALNSSSSRRLHSTC